MVHVLLHADKQVRTKLFDLVKASRKPLLVVSARHEKTMRPVPHREPFASLDRAFGNIVDLVVVVDEGTAEGMWRDPLGDLAESLFPDDKAKAYKAVQSYLLLRQGQPLALVKKVGTPEADVPAVQAALHKARIPVATPGATGKRPAATPRDTPKTEPRATPPQTKRERITPPPQPRSPPPVQSPAVDPFTVLGISKDVALADARKAYRTQVAQYHPDKVAHLAPEFRELAERRTRELNAAWEALKKTLSSA